MKSKHDWQSTLAGHWGKKPLGIPASAGAPALTAEEAFRTVVAASAPFRAGLRFFALPDVRFYAGAGRMRAPGELLPHAGDTAQGYCERVASSLRSEPFQLRVEQPLLIDFPLWSKVRGWLAGVFERVGWPALPITAEISLGDRASEGNRLGGSVMTWLVHGRTTISLSRAGSQRSGATLRAAAGAFLYWPAHFSHVEEASRDALMLRLWVPADESHAANAMANYLGELIQGRKQGDHAVPYVAFPPPLRRNGSLAIGGPMFDTARDLGKLVRDRELRRALLIRWAKRVSACGLETVPAPRAHHALRRTDWIRPSRHARVVRVRAEPGRWIWAVHGHAFSVPEQPPAAEVLAWLESAEPSRVDGVCGTGRARAGGEAVALLEKLLSLHAIELRGEEA